MSSSKSSEKDSKLPGFLNSKVSRREALTTTGKAAIGVVAAAVIGGIFAQPVMAKPATVVASINGGGTSVMEPAGILLGTTSFSMHATLQTGGSATGRVDCVDQHGSDAPGNVFGLVTSWSKQGDVVVLNVTNGKLIFPGPPSPINNPGLQDGVQSFIIKIQKFGGAGVGHWTLEDGSGLIFCSELLTSGQIVYNPA
jgi:hypothetical protein